MAGLVPAIDVFADTRQNSRFVIAGLDPAIHEAHPHSPRALKLLAR
jgi:hypothetical protein